MFLQPKLSEEKTWCILCFGEEFWRRLVTQRGVKSSSDSLDSNGDGRLSGEGTVQPSGLPPLLSIVSAMEQVTEVYFKIILKAVDTIGNCQRLAFTVGVSQHMHQITNLIEVAR